MLSKMITVAKIAAAIQFKLGLSNPDDCDFVLVVPDSTRTHGAASVGNLSSTEAAALLRAAADELEMQSQQPSDARRHLH